MTLRGSIVWVTGAGSGIGRAIALMLAGEGAHVVLMGRRADLLEGVRAEVQQKGGQGAVEPLDVSDRAAVTAAAERLLGERGRIDMLVNNAGTNVTERSLERLDPADWDRVLAVNLTGAYNMVHAVLPAMREAGGGLIVNISSLAGIAIHPLAGVAYTASKHGMTALSHHVNEEQWRHGIRACAICPGEVDTPILDARPVQLSSEARARMSRPEDVAAAVRMVALMPPRTTIGQLTIFPTRRRTLDPGEVP
ncbi:MAG: SDR family oxidoreductase [SAR324 cluster bacterium]|nr:SDR family oxidoreductase [SAR324 cluster bacterium]